MAEPHFPNPGFPPTADVDRADALSVLRAQQREVEQAIEELTRLRDETQATLRQREAGEGSRAA